MKLFCRHKIKEILFCYKTYYSENGGFKAVYVTRCTKCNKLLWYEADITDSDIKFMQDAALNYLDSILEGADKIRKIILNDKKMQDAEIKMPSSPEGENRQEEQEKEEKTL